MGGSNDQVGRCCYCFGRRNFRPGHVARAASSTGQHDHTSPPTPTVRLNVPNQVRIWGCPRCGVNGICMLGVPPLTRHRGNRRSYPDSGLTPFACPGADVVA